MSLPVVSVSRISKHFDKVIAVDDVSFDVALRSTTALLGGNGAGKTTTLSMLLGLLLPTSRSISVFCCFVGPAFRSLAWTCCGIATKCCRA